MINIAGEGQHFAAGISVGPWRDDSAEEACKQLFSRLSFIGVRDKLSYERVKNMLPDAPCSYTFDIAPQFLRISNWRPSSNQRKGIGIALCNQSQLIFGGENSINRTITAINDAIKLAKHDIDKIVFLSCNRGAGEDDEIIHNRIVECLPNSLPVQHISYNSNPLEFINHISNLKVLIAMRLHAAIFGFCTGAPTIMVAYHEKCNEWMQQIGADNCYLLPVNDICGYDVNMSINFALSSDRYQTKLSPHEAMDLSMKNWTWNL